MTDVLELFLSLLTVLCQLFVVGVLVFRLSTLTRGRRYLWARFRDAITPYTLPLAFAVATVTTAGSLYMSEVAGYTPCNLCWVQRAFLYPLVIVTALLWWRPAWRWLRVVGIALAALDVPVSIYHYLVEHVSGFQSSTCSADNPCSLIWFESFGYITLAMMALTSALTIITLLVIGWNSQSRSRSGT